MQIVKRVDASTHLIELKPVDRFQGVNVYLVNTQKGWILIDSGLNCEEHEKQLEKELKTLALSFGDIEAVFLTHGHPDHVGLASRLRIKAYLESKDRQIAKSYSRFLKTKIESVIQELNEEQAQKVRHALDKILNRIRAFDSFYPFYALSSKIAEEYALTLIRTPGHTPGSVCYINSYKTAFVGDSVIDTASVLLLDLKAYFNSLKTLRSVNASLFAPAHGGLLEPTSGVQMMERKYRKRLRACVRALDKSRNLWKVAEFVYGKELLNEELLPLILLQTKTFLTFAQKIKIWRWPAFLQLIASIPKKRLHLL
ncbi:hypothetical protein B9Q02_04630 [Candidatus Marsarchaeota G1 archaeon BE_D]|uniref:Metallo-beta-lactamase domain-containing protein n=1 Tax=Candidatus Marsarchaeota G1 archaeon BE_D TaxID=1978156 RepID=A0A2R6AHP9_9ARCH|nr:MAG: hypothetical protein B9Q02_04630 [Candidatus Marsarchaeota G1 archaeon BE_D]